MATTLPSIPDIAISFSMGGANGSRECAPDDKLRDTRQLHCLEMMGFAGSTMPRDCGCIGHPAFHGCNKKKDGLLRCARNDGLKTPCDSAV
jgi:hypothetical protein